MNELVKIAFKYYGTNPENWTFPWCAAFLNLVLDEAGVKNEGSLMARSFLTIGEHTDSPEHGDIVVLWRVERDSAWGHCGLFLGEDETYVTLLGGNQDGTVKIKKYPKWQLLDIRRIYDEKCA